MKRIVFNALLILSLLTNNANASLYSLDSIAVIIFGEETTIIITQSEIERPSIDGAMRTLDDLIFEHLVYLDAIHMKIIPDQEAIEKHLKAIQRENNLSDAQLNAIFKNAGYTFEEGRKQFELMTTINSMLDFKIRSRLMVPDSDVKAYYDANPEMESPEYYLERGFISYALQDKEELFAQLQDIVRGKPNDTIAITWGEPFWVKGSELAENKQFITELKVGAISEPQEIAGGFELFKLVEKKPERLKTLEERYREISALLRKPRYEQIMAAYRKELFDNASILYMQEDLKPTAQK